MQFQILRIILDVVVITTPYPCGDWMRDYLPLKPTNPEVVRLDPYEETGCIIRYRSSELAIPGPEFKGV